MAPKSAGSSPASPIIYYYTNSYVANHFNILNSKKTHRITIVSTNKTLKLVKSLYSARIINSYIISTKGSRTYITFNSMYYRNVPYFSHLRIISTPSKLHNVSLRALRVISKSIGVSVLLLETDKGIITHKQAIDCNTGGKLLGIIS